MKSGKLLFLLLVTPAVYPMGGLRQAIRNACPTAATKKAVQPIAKTAVYQRNWFPTLGYQPSRSIFYTSSFKGAYQELPPSLQEMAPLHGEVALRTSLLRNIYQYGMPLQPSTQLTKKFFHLQESQFRATQCKSQPAFSLTPSLLGSIMAALQNGTLGNADVQKKISDQWRTEHLKMCGGQKISQKKITDTFDLMIKSYQADPAATRSIMLGFLTAKAESKDDILTYLYNIAAQTPGITQADMNRFKELLKNVYPAQEHAEFESALIRDPKTKNMENLMCAQLHNYFGTIKYPPQVAQCHYGYKGQTVQPNCVETALQDLFNIMLFNQETKLFDFSLLPSAAQVRPEFKQFYQMQQFNPTRVNDKNVGQAWMDLVSNHDFLRYESNKNYELSGIATTDNFLLLANYFLGLHSRNFDELGTQLSTHDRTVTFRRQENGGVKTVTMNIIDHKRKHTSTAELHGKLGHGWLTVTDRNTRKPSSYAVQKAIVAKVNTATGPERYSALPLTSSIVSRLNPQELLNKDIDLPSRYCAFDFNDYHELDYVLSDILPRIKNDPALNEFAYSLVKQFVIDSNQNHHYFSEGNIRYIIESDVWQTDDRWAQFLLQYPNSTFPYMIILKKGFNTVTEEALKQLPLSSSPENDLKNWLDLTCSYNQADILQALLKKGAHKYINALSHGHTPLERAMRDKSFAVIKELLENGANPNIASSYDGNTPLHSALEKWYWAATVDGQSWLGELRAMMTEAVNFITGRQTAVQKEWFEIIRLLLAHGANPYALNQAGKRPIDFATNREIKALFNKTAK